MPIVRNGGEQLLSEEPSSPAARKTGTRSNGSTKQRGKAVAAQAGEQGSQVASRAAERGQEVAGVAGQQAREVAGLVKGQAAELTQELSAQGRSLYDETRHQVEVQAEAQAHALSQTLHRWGDETQALVDGRPADAGAVGECAQQWADGLRQLATDIEERGVNGLLDEVQGFARRRPGAFLIGAAVVGFTGGRLLRSGAGADDGSEPAELAPAPPPAPRRRSVAAGTSSRRNPPSMGGE